MYHLASCALIPNKSVKGSLTKNLICFLPQYPISLYNILLQWLPQKLFFIVMCRLSQHLVNFRESLWSGLIQKTSTLTWVTTVYRHSAITKIFAGPQTEVLLWPEPNPRAGLMKGTTVTARLFLHPLPPRPPRWDSVRTATVKCLARIIQALFTFDSTALPGKHFRWCIILIYWRQDWSHKLLIDTLLPEEDKHLLHQSLKRTNFQIYLNLRKTLFDSLRFW